MCFLVYLQSSTRARLDRVYLPIYSLGPGREGSGAPGRPRVRIEWVARDITLNPSNKPSPSRSFRDSAR